MEYTIHITAYTKIGTGPWTFANYAMTEEDGKAHINIFSKYVFFQILVYKLRYLPNTMFGAIF